ncbi:putative Transcription regulator, TetR-like [Vibrio nigripulchritudo SFn27]|uniref:Putative Transcription regulator, TetR-like n=1 Tax=Vibrio nigripulchritudo TaxID=28173 RepID=U4KD23_9VIBR|nr:TetR/AcrR family transcriptional regulator [Vibrio nigripulchritudo]CCN83149.1 putative Transcription regulator, TetR-like [Vibrio nigripulchritudo BLFn1]CCN86247.1 putative Transcription regulator, TetR-like [Vibrio nigripulchritudo SFn27]CCN92807.1 putative Transcription regulator, TetR-like [Vibrio nigripulchritudo ENn2]CCO42757.1 putative Transcription regulator, TetR-like [Vibrio nigripulchritudo SFn135]CCO52623.1 putative Transcription regulator, TetR-like [Vibrio nigripulchritudo Wn1
MKKEVKKRGRPKSSQLSKERILDTAKQLMKATGAIPSIRKLASELDVDAMAIYHYFKNKNVLLEAITISLVDGIYEPQDNQNWTEELKFLCRSYVSLLDTYSGLLQTLLTMKSTGPAEVFITRFERIVQPLSLDEGEQQAALELLVDYLHGLALALNCNSDREQLNVDRLDGILDFYCRSLSK